MLLLILVRCIDAQQWRLGFSYRQMLLSFASGCKLQARSVMHRFPF